MSPRVKGDSTNYLSKDSQTAYLLGVSYMVRLTVDCRSKVPKPLLGGVGTQATKRGCLYLCDYPHSFHAPDALSVFEKG